MNPLSLKQGLDILREINIGAIQQEAEHPFTLLLVGRPELTALLAPEIETVPGQGRLLQVRAPLPVGLEIQRPAAALLASGPGVVDADLAQARRQLEDARVPTVAVQIGVGVPGAAAIPLGDDSGTAAPVVVRADAGRVSVPDNPSATDIASAVAPAMVALDQPEAETLLPLARQFPAFREAYIRDLIEDVSRVNASYAFSTGIAQVVPVLGLPLALADIVVLTKNQLVMAYKIALAAGKPATGRLLVGELVGILGGGLLFRQIARELVGLAPGIGIVPKVAIAYAGTRLVGQVASVWALEGRKLEGSELGHMYREALDGGRRMAAELQARAGRTRRRGADSAADGSEEVVRDLPVAAGDAESVTR